MMDDELITKIVQRLKLNNGIIEAETGFDDMFKELINQATDDLALVGIDYADSNKKGYVNAVLAFVNAIFNIDDTQTHDRLMSMYTQLLIDLQS